jgi:hypothetical protein
VEGEAISRTADSRTTETIAGLTRALTNVGLGTANPGTTKGEEMETDVVVGGTEVGRCLVKAADFAVARLLTTTTMTATCLGLEVVLFLMMTKDTLHP